MRKNPKAFKTISEVADEIQISQHTLRFWETKFPQICPLKRGGGRRCYRPEEVDLLRKIADLLHVQGYTIKGVQKLLRDEKEAAFLLKKDLPSGPNISDIGQTNAAPSDDSIENIFMLAQTTETSVKNAPLSAKSDEKELSSSSQNILSILKNLLYELEALRSDLISLK